MRINTIFRDVRLIAASLAAAIAATICLLVLPERQSPSAASNATVKATAARLDRLKTNANINFDFVDFLHDRQKTEPLITAFDSAAAARGYQRCRVVLGNMQVDLPIGYFGPVTRAFPNEKFFQASFTDAGKYTEDDMWRNRAEPHAVVTYSTRCPASGYRPVF